MSIATSEKLAQVLHAHGLFDLENKARRGDYDDFKSDSATPIMNLVRDLGLAGQKELAARAMQGEWDSTTEESEAS